MKQIKFKELINQTVIAVDESVINAVLLTTTLNEELHYYWIDTESSFYDINIPCIYELVAEEAQTYLASSITDTN